MNRPILIAAAAVGLVASSLWSGPEITEAAQAPTPSPRPTTVSRKAPPPKVARTPMAARSHARGRLGDLRQFKCLDKLWTHESNWRPDAQGKIRINGRLPGGIPQILGLNPKSSVEKQIDRGLAYIVHRYGTPCQAWDFWKSKAYYRDGRWRGGWY